MKILRETIEKMPRELNTERKIKKRNKKINKRGNLSKSSIKYVTALFFINLKHINFVNLTIYI